MHPLEQPMNDHENDVAFRDAGLTPSSIAMLVLGWIVVSLIAFFAADAVTARFFDLPLGAFFAGQGALVWAVVVIGLRRRDG